MPRAPTRRARTCEPSAARRFPWRRRRRGTAPGRCGRSSPKGWCRTASRYAIVAMPVSQRLSFREITRQTTAQTMNRSGPHATSPASILDPLGKGNQLLVQPVQSFPDRGVHLRHERGHDAEIGGACRKAIPGEEPFVGSDRVVVASPGEGERDGGTCAERGGGPEGADRRKEEEDVEREAGSGAHRHAEQRARAPRADRITPSPPQRQGRHRQGQGERLRSVVAGERHERTERRNESRRVGGRRARLLVLGIAQPSPDERHSRQRQESRNPLQLPRGGE